MEALCSLLRIGEVVKLSNFSCDPARNQSAQDKQELEKKLAVHLCGNLPLPAGEELFDLIHIYTIWSRIPNGSGCTASSFTIVHITCNVSMKKKKYRFSYMKIFVCNRHA